MTASPGRDYFQAPAPGSVQQPVGFGLGDAGLVATPFLPMVTLPLVFAGVILGVLAAVLTLLIFLVVMPASVTMSPS